jgi:hypothetical protein
MFILLQKKSIIRYLIFNELVISSYTWPYKKFGSVQQLRTFYLTLNSFAFYSTISPHFSFLKYFIYFKDTVVKLKNNKNINFFYF